jgi:hypothetical protein
MNSRRQAFTLVGLAAALVLMWAPGPTGAAPGSNTDPDDVALQLDLKSVSHTNDGSSITYTAETYENFPDKAADFKWGIDKNGDESFDLFASAEWDVTELVGGVEDAAENPVADAAVSRPAPNAIKIVFPVSVLSGAASYRYAASTEDDVNGNGVTDPGEQDLAPDAGLITHDLGSAPASQAPTGGSGTAPVAAPAPVKAPAPGPAARPAPAPAPVAVPETPRVPAAASPATPAPAPAAAAPKAANPAPAPKVAAGAPAQEIKNPEAAPAVTTPDAAAPAEAPPSALARTGSADVLLALFAGLALMAAGFMFFAETLVPTTRQRA